MDENLLQLSSAASCISLTLLENSFRPVFTHQLFDNEVIQGYEPSTQQNIGLGKPSRHDVITSPPNPNTKEDKNDEPNSNNDSHCTSDGNPKNDAFHPSYSYHAEATHRLHISIQLSPSCRVCHINLHIEEKTNNCAEEKRSLITSTSSTNTSKRPLPSKEDCTLTKKSKTSKNDTNGESESGSVVKGAKYNSIDSQQKENKLNGDENVDRFVLLEDKSGILNPESSSLGPKRRLLSDEIIVSLKKALPTQGHDLPFVQNDYLSSPVGTCLDRYRNGGKDFVLTLAEGCCPDTVKYHDTVQNLALWFIETADAVDVSSKNGGFWKILVSFPFPF